MITERLYYFDSLLDNCNTIIAQIGKDEIGSYFIPKKTIFHPKGGGQPNDEGRVIYKNSSFKIINLKIEKDFIKHYINHNIDDSWKNQNIDLEIDIDKRKLFSRYHTAGHLISDIINKLNPNLEGYKGNHFPDQAYVVFKIKNKNPVELKKEDFSDIDLEKLKIKLEEKLKEDISENIQISINNQENERKMKIGNNKYFNCGGTHIKKLNELEEVIITKIKFKKKEGLKISYLLR